MSKEKKERKFDSELQDFLDLDIVPAGKRKNNTTKKSPQKMEPVDNKLDVVTKLIDFLKE